MITKHRSHLRKFTSFFFVTLFVPSSISAPFLDPDDPAYTGYCNFTGDPVYSVSITDIEGDVADSNRFRFSFEFLNWSTQFVGKLTLVQNTAGSDFGRPYVSNAFFDSDGRPISGASSPPAGNIPRHITSVNTALSAGVNQVNTRIDFSAFFIEEVGKIVYGPRREYSGQSGLMPWFSDEPVSRCNDLVSRTGSPSAGFIVDLPIIPGGVLSAGPAMQYTVSNYETIDNGINVLDGFVVEIADWNPGEEISFNWFFNDASAGRVDAITGQIIGDPYGFGTINLVRLDGPAFGVPFVGNEGYDPGEPGLPNQDLPINWREDEVAGADTYPINPIPSSEPGGGTYFGVEYGTATTAPFLDPNDNFFQITFGGALEPVGVNLQEVSQERIPMINGFAMALLVFILVMLVELVSGKNGRDLRSENAR